MSNVLITGIAGFIGSHVAELLLEDSIEFTGVDNYSTGLKENVREVGYTLAVNNMDIVNDGLPPDEYDVIIHLAAQPSLLNSERNPGYDAQVNILGTLRVIEKALRDESHLVFASTSAVYAENASGVYHESSWCNPKSPYGLSKYTAESYLHLLMPTEQYTILRFGNVYGPRQVPLGENQLVPRTIRHLLFGDEFEIYGSGEQTRDFIYVKDVARATVQAGLDKWMGTYNISSGDDVSVNDILKQIGFWHSDFKGANYTWKHGEQRDDRSRIRMSNGLARTQGWKPEVDLATGLKQTYDWWVSHGS